MLLLATGAHALPVKTFMVLLVELKYNAPVNKAPPSLSVEGAELLTPRYLSSKLS